MCIYTAPHRAIVRKVHPKPERGGIGIDQDKANAIQARIDEFVNHMSALLRVERDAELEYTQDELDAAPALSPDDDSKSIDYLVSHGHSEEELCDTLCNLTALSCSKGKHFVI